MRSNEATPLSSQATASPSMIQERERRRANVSTISGGFASKRLRRRVLHQCSHLGTKTCGRIQLDRCCLVIRMQKVKPFAPNFDCYVERIDCPTAPQHPHRGRDCQRREERADGRAARTLVVAASTRRDPLLLDDYRAFDAPIAWLPRCSSPRSSECIRSAPAGLLPC
jgi:hypothetical protein